MNEISMYNFLSMLSSADLEQRREYLESLVNDKNQDMPWMISTWKKAIEKINNELNKRNGININGK